MWGLVRQRGQVGHQQSERHSFVAFSPFSFLLHVLSCPFRNWLFCSFLLLLFRNCLFLLFSYEICEFTQQNVRSNRNECTKEMFDFAFVLNFFLSTKIFPLHIEACPPAKIFRPRLLCYVTRYLLTSICVTLTFHVTCTDSEMCFHNS